MSFILESIKQAERDRKLGQQKAPEISIEYSGAHIGDIESNKKGWLLFLTGLTVTAILMWGAAYYLTNKDRQYVGQLSVNEFGKVADVEAEVNVQAQAQAQAVSQVDAQVEIKSQVESAPVTQEEISKQNTSFAPVSVKKLHTSDLKSVKLITEQEKAPVPRAVSESKKIKQPVKSITAQKSNFVAETGKVSNEELATELPVVKKSQVLTTGTESVSNKQELARIYTDLASLDNTKSMEGDVKPLSKVEEQPVQLKTANYVVPEASALINKKYESAKLSTNTSYTRQHEQAVNSGVPSFGELSYDIQERIPDLNVSVHMFHADPLQRRIRINGQMYTEGKSLQQGLALVEITRYGAVFDYQGNLFRFNVR